MQELLRRGVILTKNLNSISHPSALFCHQADYFWWPTVAWIQTLYKCSTRIMLFIRVSNGGVGSSSAG